MGPRGMTPWVTEGVRGVKQAKGSRASRPAPRMQRRHARESAVQKRVGEEEWEGLTVVASEVGLLAVEAGAVSLFLLRTVACPRLCAGVAVIVGTVGCALAFGGVFFLGI